MIAANPTRASGEIPLTSPPLRGMMAEAAVIAPSAVAGGRLNEAPLAIHIAYPASGLNLLKDPETPPDLATLSLQAVVDPPAPQVVWYVNGSPFKVVDYPYAARWPLESGEHTFQVRVPYTDATSRPVRITVR